MDEMWLALTVLLANGHVPAELDDVWTQMLHMESRRSVLNVHQAAWALEPNEQLSAIIDAAHSAMFWADGGYTEKASRDAAECVRLCEELQ